MVYQSLVAGAKGIFYFTYNGSQFKLYNSPQGMRNVNNVNDELKKLAPILLSDSLKHSDLQVFSDNNIKSRQFIYKNQLYVILVNLNNKFGNIAMSTRSSKPLIKVESFFSGIFKNVSGGMYYEELEPFGRRVYKVIF